jgi:DnaJ family protein B protein 11
MLHIPKSADDNQIKRAYRKLALKMHPDKVQGSEEEKKEAAAKFAEISHAYEVLSDSEKRKVYDRFGEEGLKQMGQNGGGGGGGGGFDPFSQFFGGFPFGWGGGGDGEEQTPRGHDVVVEMEVPLKDLYLGAHIPVTRDKNVIKPASGTRKCNCKQKVVTQQVGPGMYQQYTTRVCEDCPNLKYERVADQLTVNIDPGMPDGHQISFFEEGEPLIDGEPGDLIMVIVTQPHFMFQRENDDLHMEYTISLLDALVGFEKEFAHLDEHKVKLQSSGVTRPGQVDKIEGEGMPRFERSGKGDLYVKYMIAFPKNVSEAEKQQLNLMFGKAEWQHDEL